MRNRYQTEAFQTIGPGPPLLIYRINRGAALYRLDIRVSWMSLESRVDHGKNLVTSLTSLYYHLVMRRNRHTAPANTSNDQASAQLYKKGLPGHRNGSRTMAMLSMAAYQCHSEAAGGWEREPYSSEASILASDLVLPKE